MSTIRQLTDYLESIAPLSLQESYDNAGLICGDHENSITGVLCSLDTTEEVVDEAIQLGCNVIVGHHPIIFKGLKKINGYHYVERAIINAIKNDIAIYAIHTNLDNIIFRGVNEKIAEKLGLVSLKAMIPKPLYPSNANESLLTGTGIVGDLPAPMSEIKFLEFLKNAMQTNVIKHTSLLQIPVHKVAVCGGAGSSFLPAAIQSGAQVYISADFKYHEYFEADHKILITDIGHYESEQFTIELLFDLITNKFSNFASHYTKLDTNPVKYFK